MDLATLALHEFTAGVRSEAGLLEGSANRHSAPPRSTLRRCRTREQGVALQTVSHAIEYLVDSRLVNQKNTSEAEREALAILLDANQSVYNDGAEITPLAWPFLRWFRGGELLHSGTNNAHV